MTPPEASRFPTEPDRHAAARMWAEHLEAHPEHRGEDPPSERFGDSPAPADELLDLVLHGPKRATAGAVAEFRQMPRPGPHARCCAARSRAGPDAGRRA